jgi:formate-nitrite transporter family protein
MDKNIKQSITQSKEVFEILEELTKVGIQQHKRPNRVLFLSAFGAGLEIGFSILLMGVIYTLFHGEVSDSVLHILLAMSYPIGFIFVVIGRSELFTEHTTIAVLPVLQGKYTIKHLLRLWVTVLIGNLLAGFLFSYMLYYLPVSMNIIDLSTFEALALPMLQFNAASLVGSATLAGWLMGLMAWMVTSSKETISQIVFVGLITFVIGIAGLHHSVVGSIEMFTGMLASDKIHFSDYLYFQSLAVLGNIVGGSLFVGILKYSHTRRSDQKE